MRGSCGAIEEREICLLLLHFFLFIIIMTSQQQQQYTSSDEKHPRLLPLVVGYVKEIVDAYEQQKQQQTNTNSNSNQSNNPLMEMDIPNDICQRIAMFYQMTIEVYGRGSDCGQFGRGDAFDGGEFGREYLTEFIKLTNLSEMVTDAGDLHVFYDTLVVHNHHQQQIYASGDNELGQCGVGDEENICIYEFTPIAFPSSTSTISFTNVIISEGAYACYVIMRLADGSFYGWGDNEQKQLGIGEHEEEYYHSPHYLKEMSEIIFRGLKIIQIQCGTHHTVFLSDNGQVFACGGNEDFECGFDSNEQAVLIPTKIGGVLDGIRVKQIAVGHGHNLCLGGDNRNVFAFGYNYHHQLGFETNENHSIAKKVTYFDDMNVKQVIAGYNCSAVILENGKCFMFGSNVCTLLFTVKKSHPCDIHCIQQTLRDYGDFSEFDSDNDYRPLSPAELLRLQWIFSEEADMKVVDVAFGFNHTIITANIKVNDGDGEDDDEQYNRQQVLLSAGSNHNFIISSQVKQTAINIPYEFTMHEIVGLDLHEQQQQQQQHQTESSTTTHNIIEKAIANGHSTMVIIKGL